jgi:cytochrome c oxidase subunit III
MSDAPLGFQYADLCQQQDAAHLGMWTFLATEVLFFGGLILAYCVYRSATPEGFAAAAHHTKIIIGTANTAVLLTSSLLVAWAVTAARADRGQLGCRLLSVAAFLGVIFLALKGFEYRLEYDERLLPGVNFASSDANATATYLFFSFYLVATGLHAVHVAIGIVVLVIMARQANRLRYSKQYHSPITLAGLYWHFVDVVWIFLFALIYLPGRAAS